MKFSRRFTLLALLTTFLFLPATSQVRTYEVITATVPFKFAVGDRAFRPGRYQFIIVGTGLLALRDEHQHVIATLVTQSIETGGPSPGTELLFNKTKKNRSQLARITLANRSQVLDVTGEQLAILSSRPAQMPSSALPIDGLSLTGGRNGIRLRQ